MPYKEKDQGELVLLETILNRYNLPITLPENALVFFDGTKSLCLKEALKMPPNELVGPALGILIHKEELVVSSRKADGKMRSKREKNDIRGQYEKERANLLLNGPGRTLAVIAENSGRQARWTKQGLVGVDSDWVEPPKEEYAWWAWVYGKVQKGLGPDKLYLGNTGIILHAAFLMRFRVRSGLITAEVINGFIREMTPLIPEPSENGELISLLREIAGYRSK